LRFIESWDSTKSNRIPRFPSDHVAFAGVFHARTGAIWIINLPSAVLIIVS
jgi:hypothetical protein